MMNRKGFTLIEILLVIVIMAMLLLVLAPNVFVLLNTSKEKSCKSLITNIESSAKIYVTNNKNDLGFTCSNTKNITFQTLVDSGDLVLDSSGQIKNPLNDNQIALTNTVSVKYNCNTKEFTYKVNGIDCTNN